jgi:hypothetical protein
MLGLGASVVYSPVVSEPLPEATYESDFTSGTDGFEGYSIDEDIVILGNRDGEPSEDPKDDVLRATLSDDAENNGGISRNMASNFTNRSVGDVYKVSLEIFLDSAYGSVTNGWDGTDDVTTSLFVGGATSNVDIPQNQWHSISDVSITATSTSSGDNHFRIIWSVSGSQMQEGARFYLKNVKIEQFK